MRKYTILKSFLAGAFLLLLLAISPATQAQGVVTVCDGEEVILTLSGYHGQIQWEFSSDNVNPYAAVTGVTGDSASIFPDEDGFYRAQVIDGTCDPVYSDTFEIRVLENPIVNAGADTSICMGESLTLGGSPTATGNQPPFTYSWNPAAGLSSATAANPTATPAASLSYILTVTDSFGCVRADTVSIGLNPLPVVLAGPDSLINCGDSIQLGATASGGSAPYTYSWSPGTLSDPNIANPWAYPSGATNYIASVSDLNGCVGMDSAMITVSGQSTGADTFEFTGVIDTTWVVPPCADTLTIEVWGAQGGNNNTSNNAPGMGAYQKGDFALAAGTRLKILVGEQPSTTGGNGGGGGSFVTLTNNTPLIIAGGGGGSSQTTDSPDKHGQAGTTGGTGAAGGGTGGTNGNGGNIGASGFQSGAGGGLLTDGADGWTSNTGGDAFVNGGGGATANSNARGGFGGGGSGSSYVVGGGGGGYSGGGSGGNSSAGVGGGGGSFNGGANPTSTSGVNSGHGRIIISW